MGRTCNSTQTEALGKNQFFSSLFYNKMMLNEITLFEDLLCCDLPTLKENEHIQLLHTHESA